MIQIVFCLLGYTGIQLEAFIVSVRIPTPGVDHHWTAAPYYDDGITQDQELPAVCGINVWSPRAEIPNYLGTCGSMGYVLANTALKLFLLWTTCWALSVCCWYRSRNVWFGCYLLFFSLGISSGPHSLQFARVNACRQVVIDCKTGQNTLQPLLSSGAYFLVVWIWVGLCYLLWVIKYKKKKKSGDVWIPNLGHKRLCSFCSYALKTQSLPWEKAQISLLDGDLTQKYVLPQVTDCPPTSETELLC